MPTSSSIKTVEASDPSVDVDFDEKAHDEELLEHAKKRRKFWIGIGAGLLAAFLYTLTNIYLRRVATSGDWIFPILVQFHKTLPVTLLGWFLVVRQKMRGEMGLPPLKAIPTLIATGFLMQFGGNLLFQYALGYCGLALTVPVIFAFIIVGGAIMGRIILKEAISIRSLFSICLLIIAIVTLSFGMSETSNAVVKDTALTDLASGPTTWEMVWGLLAASLSGASYGLGGVLIRKNVCNLPIASTLVLITSVGTFGFLSICLVNIGWEGFIGLDWDQRQIMLVAGVFNAVAFYLITLSLRLISVIQSNLMNATQILMAAIAGVLFFHEPMTIWLQLGLVLTVVGLVTMDRAS